jgi:hypothetical protein
LLIFGLISGLDTAPVAFADEPDAKLLAAQIDEHLETAWEQAGVHAGNQIDDATFLRRVYLDLVGRIPTVAETQAFLEDSQPQKRELLVEQLIASGGYARHFATVWRRIWVPQADTPEFARLTEDFEAWAAVRIRDNVPYDKLVQELLLASRDATGKNEQSAGREVSPIGFLAASQFRAEELAANTTRAFLGLNLDCAQCHDHPFSRWTRNQFWETAAFFAAPRQLANSQTSILEVTIPDTERHLQPKLLDNTAPQWPAEIGSHTGPEVLAAWIVDQENPYFARNAVNRIWAHFFGRGLIEPLDDISDDNPSSLPELHRELAAAFIASGYDLKFITKALVQTRAYQLAAQTTASAEAEELHVFQQMPIRGLTGEQLYDSMVVAAGLPTVRHDLLSSRDLGLRERFATQMHVERVVDAERSIVQSLALMNGELSRELTTPAQSPLLTAAADAPFLNEAEKVDMLFLAVLSRRPTQQESRQWQDYLAGKDLTTDDEPRSQRAALADVLWVLLNSSEFNTNH